MKKITILFAALLSFAGGVKAETLTENFNGNLPEGWSIVGDLSHNNDRARSGKGIWTSSKSDNANYLTTEAVEGSITLYARAYNKSTNAYVFVYAYDGSALGDQLYMSANMKTSSTPSWTSYTINLGTYKGQVAIALNYAAIDDLTYTQMEAVEGPALAVKDGSTKLTSPYTYNFGLTTAGTTKTFTLTNPGTAALGISVSETGNFGATLSAATIAAGGEVTLTVTMPATTGSSTVTITPASGSGIDPFVINVSGTVRDANKVYEDDFSALPEDWTTTGSWYYSSTNGAYTTSWYLSSEARLITPQLTVSDGETFFVEAKGYSTSNTSYQHLQMQYSADGTTWTNFDSEPALDPSNWQIFAFTGVPAGKYYIAINASQADIRMFYGGELPNEPKMVVTQPASLDFGVITEATAKTFTIANTGKATLEGISVTSSNSSIFAVSGAPTSLAAGESAEVTIAMAATTTGALSSDITVSATGMTDVVFTVTGVVLPDGMPKEEFTDGLPANWTNASWTFADGAATGKSSSAYLTTPKLQFSDGDLLVIKAKRYDSETSDYLTVQGSSDNGSTWTAYSKKLQNADGLTYPDYGTIVLTDIPSTVNKLRFIGYYVVVDEIAGLTYAPVLSVTQEGTAVVSPANYDFGECVADASATYNFANAGAGTIDITNVAITGDGAAAYSTNWTTSVATPFDLTITRTYDATRTGAQDAVVTVTTTDGDFVINVTGTDKAANAPELAVSPAEDAVFGVVTAAAEKTYTVTNAGTGLLTVNIYSNDAKFTVAPAKLTDIAAGESQTFTVTFTPVAETYGTFTAEIVVVPTYDGNAAVPFNASAKVKDPNLWEEDFATDAVPTGWNAGSNWTIANGVAKAAYAYGSTTYLTTPALTVADATDELAFDYKATANYVSIKIQMSKDGGAFADYQTISDLNNGDAGTYAITGLEAGDYQFRFANDDYELDNFEGFKLNLADHIAIISASSIPESSSWSVTMKEGRSFEATVTVKEMRGVAEELTAKLYMGTEVIGTATGSVAANSTETLTITATPTTAAPDGAQMHIEVEYAGGTLSTEAVTRYVAALTYLTLDETSSDAVVAGTYDYVTLKRTFAQGWNTVCLPFTISDVEGFFGAGAKAYEFSSYGDDGSLGFTKVTTLTASYPYVVYVPTAITDDIELTNVTIASTDASAWYTRKANSSNSAVYFRGTYAPVAAGEWTKNDASDIIYGVTPAGKIAKAGATAHINGFRAYFDVPTVAEIKSFSFDGEDADAISLIQTDAEENDAIYNIAGQRMGKMQKGINIVNGKKVLF